MSRWYRQVKDPWLSFSSTLLHISFSFLLVLFRSSSFAQFSFFSPVYTYICIVGYRVCPCISSSLRLKYMQCDFRDINTPFLHLYRRFRYCQEWSGFQSRWLTNVCSSPESHEFYLGFSERERKRNSGIFFVILFPLKKTFYQIFVFKYVSIFSVGTGRRSWFSDNRTFDWYLNNRNFFCFDSKMFGWYLSNQNLSVVSLKFARESRKLFFYSVFPINVCWNKPNWIGTT